MVVSRDLQSYLYILNIEDKPENAVVGLEAGLIPILINHEHNKDFSRFDIPKVENWKDIYEMIVY